RAQAQMLGPGGQLVRAVALDDDLDGIGLLDGELVPEVERDRRRIESRPHVRRRRRGPDRDRKRHRTAAAIDSGSASTERAGSAERAAVSGSLSPWPVTTHTTVLPRSGGSRSSAAIPAAADGSQKR